MSSLKIFAAAALAAAASMAFAQGTPPQPATNPAVGAGQRSTQNTPMGTTGTPGGGGAAAQGSTGTMSGATGGTSSGSMTGSTAGTTSGSMSSGSMSGSTAAGTGASSDSMGSRSMAMSSGGTRHTSRRARADRN